MAESAITQRREIVREDLSPQMSNNRLAFVLHNLLSPEECALVTKAAENVGFKRAMVRTGFKTTEYQPSHREGENCYLMDADIRQMLFERVKDHLPKEFRFGRLVGLNDRLTVLRYGPGGYFREHTDGTVITQDDSAISFVTIQLYLNEAFEGGETTFFPDGPAAAGKRRRVVAVTPRTGSAAIFEHKILHEGSEVRSGTKFTLRADVLYTRYYPPADSSSAKTVEYTTSEAVPQDLPWEQPSLWSKCTVQ